MARQKEFNRDEALMSALTVFRKQGFAGTTTDDLRHAIGIGRQSFYDTFKGKKEIYSEALRLYADSRFSLFLETFRSSESPLKAIETMLMTIPNEDKKERLLACLGVSSICEFGDTDKDVSRINKEAGTSLKTVLEKLVAEGQARGEIKSSLRADAVAQFLLTLFNGLRVNARAGAAPETLSAAIKVAIDGFKEK